MFEKMSFFSKSSKKDNADDQQAKLVDCIKVNEDSTFNGMSNAILKKFVEFDAMMLKDKQYLKEPLCEIISKRYAMPKETIKSIVHLSLFNPDTGDNMGCLLDVLNGLEVITHSKAEGSTTLPTDFNMPKEFVDDYMAEIYDDIYRMLDGARYVSLEDVVSLCAYWYIKGIDRDWNGDSEHN